LQVVSQPEMGEQVFIASLHPATISPEVLYHSPVWEQVFRTTKASLLVLE